MARLLVCVVTHYDVHHCGVTNDGDDERKKKYYKN